MALLPSLRGLSAEAAGLLLLEAVEDFVGEAPPHDDLSMVVLKRLPLPARLPARLPAPSAVVQQDASATSPE